MIYYLIFFKYFRIYLIYSEKYSSIYLTEILIHILYEWAIFADECWWVGFGFKTLNFSSTVNDALNFSIFVPQPHQRVHDTVMFSQYWKIMYMQSSLNLITTVRCLKKN